MQTTLNPDAAALLASSGLGAGGGGPIRVDSLEASFQDVTRTATFLGKVRAWRGSDVLLADQLRLDEATSTLTASGAVKSLWQAPSGPAAQPAPQPIEITAASLIYGATKLVYQGNVLATQGTRRLRCDEATIELDDRNRARRILGRGKASLEEDSGLRKVTGDSLDYDLVARLVTLRGEPVIVVDAVRGRAEGRVVVYDVASGGMRLSATDPPAGGKTGA